jgi:outer membrane protein assembly factor BamB
MSRSRWLPVGAALFLFGSLTTGSASAATLASHDEEASARGWTQFQFSAAKTGWNRDEERLTRHNVASLRQRWASPPGLSGSPVVVGERVIGELGGALVALSTRDGRMLWTRPLGGDVAIPPGALASGDGLVVVTTSTGTDAVRLRSGALVWHTSAVAGSRGPTIAGDTVYVGSYDHHVYALSLRTGRVKWSTATTDEVHSTIAVSGRTAYVGADNELLALDTATGAVRWHTAIGSVHGGGPSLRDGTVYIAADLQGEGSSGQLYAVRASSGAVVWRANLGDDVHAAPSVDGTNVYIGLIDNGVFAFDARTGQPRWNRTVDGEVWTAASIAGGVVYVTVDTSQVVGLDARTGAIRWSASADPRDFSTQTAPAVTGGRLYVGFGSAGIHAYAPRH